MPEELETRIAEQAEFIGRLLSLLSDCALEKRMLRAELEQTRIELEQVRARLERRFQ